MCYQALPTAYSKVATPFLKWAGGKTRLLPHLLPLIPDAKDFDSYYEPFLGGGALFFRLEALGLLEGKRVVLGDFNPALMATYQAVRDDVSSVIEKLHAHARLHSAEYFSTIRDAVNAPVDESGTLGWTADRLIYLNKTCFNGLMRYSKAGRFNSGWGKRAAFKVDVVGLESASKALRGVTLVSGSYEGALALEGAAAGARSLVYLDAPYVPLKANSFTRYTADGFGSEEQVKLVKVARDLRDDGAHVILSNSDTPWTRELYHDFTLTRVLVGRPISQTPLGRARVGELVIST